MKAWRVLPGAICLAASCCWVSAQTPSPVLGSIEAPYAPLQGTAKIGGTTWAAGVTAYGPAGTPLVISGSNLGGGAVQFIAYKNGTVDSSVGVNGVVQATVTLWTSNMLVLTVPSGAYSGLVKVFVEGQYSNPLPFLERVSKMGSASSEVLTFEGVELLSFCHEEATEAVDG